MTPWLVVLVLALGGLAYPFAAYPVILWLRAKGWPRPVRKAPFEPAVAIVLAVHNGEDRIRAKLESCLAQDYPADRLRVIVASDGSTDGTNSAVAALRNPRVVLLRFAERRGKAACLNDAVAFCKEPFIVFTDVRQPLAPDAVRVLMENMADERVAVVSGKLVSGTGSAGALGEGLGAYLRYEQALRRLESRSGSLVGVTGALYALRRECFRRIPAGTILDDMLIPLNAACLKRRVVFEERAIAYEPAMDDPVRERMRKVRTLAGNFQLLASRPGLLLPWRNPLAFELFSHKVMRLAGPLFLAAALVSNIALAGDHPLFAAALAMQTSGYVAAGAAGVFPRAAGWRAPALAFAFLAMNFCILLAAREFVTNRHVHLWQPTPTRLSARE